MAGGRGRGKGGASKSKPKTPSEVSAEPVPKPKLETEPEPEPEADFKPELEPEADPKPEPELDPEPEPEHVDTQESPECLLDGEEKKDEIPSTDEMEIGDTISELVVGNGSEEKEQLADEGSDDEKNAMNEVNDDQVDSLSGELEEESEEVSDGDDATNDVDTENEEVDTEEEIEEEESDDGVANNIDVEDDEGTANEEDVPEDNEPINDCHDNKDIFYGEENKETEVDAEGKMIINEGSDAAKHGVTDEEMTIEGESDKPIDEELLGTPVDNGKMAYGEENVRIANNVKASPETANKPKRKLVKKTLIKKKIVRKNDVASMTQAKPQSSTGNDAAGNAKKVEKAEVKQPVKVNKKLNRKQKEVVPESHGGITAASDGQKSEPTNNELGNEVYKKTDEGEVKGEEAENSGNKVNHLKKKRKQKATKADTRNVVTGDINKPGPSRKGKSSKKVDSMGMIFMCTSETKKDCYRYKVLGLPARKKDFVLKIYKGMRLFLYDVELKMLYGIYKAADPGGYNIEPRAFKSQYPSQVRFTVLEECVPIAEENFRRVIKENYYTKNKFNCQLTNEQVKKLCKLFHEATKRADSKRIVRRNPVEAAPPSARRDKKRKRVDEGRKAAPVSSAKRDRRRRHADEELRRPPVVIDSRYYQRPVVYERDAYLPPPTAPVQVVYQPLPPSSPPRSASYSYGRPSRVDIYRRDSALERRDFDLSSLRRPVEAARRESYSSYRENHAYHEPTYETGIRRDPYEPSARRDPYELSSRRDPYEPSARREHYDYTSDPRRVEYYRVAEERPPLPPYRRY